ncbi:PA14 domain-containing protein [Streptomyces mobaraensis]|uniref:Cellulose 1,4-beta-cellobiosidase n=1 Tax=Streptomyces mobaraensis TaxID=35621 RepID=A0A5N5WBB6_STRMB|nr:PA14 domain-containing protein [Streptomyces mobaraensis]KAB7848533.1 cellulose 1,4-beta-cellobiosidase [Streptomyces mobaraensis]
MHGRNAVRRASATTLVIASAALGLTVPTGPASAAPVSGCAPGVWKAEFFAGTTFAGKPKKTGCDDAIAENYGNGAPAGLPRDNFGVRWTTTRDFGSGGPFTLATEIQGGVRVYVDKTRAIDLWKSAKGIRKKSVRITVPQGKHTLRVEYANVTGPAAVKFTYAPVTGKPDDKVKPLAPAGTRAAYDAASGKATVTWAGNSELDLAGYQVHRRALPATGKPGPWQTVSGAKPVTRTSLTDRPAKDGSGYAYAVTAVDKAGNVSARSAEVRVTTPKPTPPAPAAPSAPAGLKVVSANGKQAELSWAKNTEPDVREYQVWRRAAGHDWELTATTAGTSAIDTPKDDGTAYEYAVVAVAEKTRSERSAPVSFTPEIRRPGEPGIPTGLKVTGIDGRRAKLSWDKSPYEDHVIAYRIWRRDAQHDWKAIGKSGSSVLSYTDDPTVDGTTYEYALSAVAVNEWEGKRSAQTVRFTPEFRGAPQPPFALEAYDTPQGVKLYWRSLDNAPSFRVYVRKEHGGPAFTLAGTLRNPGDGRLEFLDTNTGRDRLTYYVVAVSKDGVESGRSNLASVEKR